MTDWLASLDPRIVQGIFALLSVITGSGTALYIAIFVYSRQKNLDARIKLAEETRKTCAELAQLCTSMIDEPANKSETALQSVGAKLARANYYENLLIMQRAPSPLILSAQGLTKAYGTCLKSLYEAFVRGEQADPNFATLAQELFEKRALFVMTARDYIAPNK